MEGHRVIQHDNVNGTGQRAHRPQTPLLYFDPQKESQHREAQTKQQHALLGIGEDHQKIERPQRQRGKRTVDKVDSDHAWVRQTHRQRSHHRNHHHCAVTGSPACPQPEQRSQHTRERGAPEVHHGMVTFRGLDFHHRFSLQHLLFRGADFGIADHATLQQQIARCRPSPGI